MKRPGERNRCFLGILGCLLRRGDLNQEKEELLILPFQSQRRLLLNIGTKTAVKNLCGEFWCQRTCRQLFRIRLTYYTSCKQSSNQHRNPRSCSNSSNLDFRSNMSSGRPASPTTSKSPAKLFSNWPTRDPRPTCRSTCCLPRLWRLSLSSRRSW
jgi:hypothetical protein